MNMLSTAACETMSVLHGVGLLNINHLSGDRTCGEGNFALPHGFRQLLTYYPLSGDRTCGKGKFALPHGFRQLLTYQAFTATTGNG